MTSLKTSIKTITYLSDIGCLEIQGASLLAWEVLLFLVLMALQLMAKAADNADWKARWGSVHHTDRTLLAHYRASLKSAIQRKANITQAISRYEKLLNRTQKAATDIKRLRPLVEDAINKGILDVDPDLVNHANEFLVIGDRSWRTTIVPVISFALSRWTSTASAQTWRSSLPSKAPNRVTGM